MYDVFYYLSINWFSCFNIDAGLNEENFFNVSEEYFKEFMSPPDQLVVFLHCYKREIEMNSNKSMPMECDNFNNTHVSQEPLVTDAIAQEVEVASVTFSVNDHACILSTSKSTTNNSSCVLSSSSQIPTSPQNREITNASAPIVNVQNPHDGHYLFYFLYYNITFY